MGVGCVPLVRLAWVLCIFFLARIFSRVNVNHELNMSVASVHYGPSLAACPGTQHVRVSKDLCARVLACVCRYVWLFRDRACGRRPNVTISLNISIQ